MTAAGRRLAQAMTAARETIQLGLDEIERHPVDHRELRILVPATLSMHWLAPRLPQIEQAGRSRILSARAYDPYGRGLAFTTA